MQSTVKTLTDDLGRYFDTYGNFAGLTDNEVFRIRDAVIPAIPTLQTWIASMCKLYEGAPLEVRMLAGHNFHYIEDLRENYWKYSPDICKRNKEFSPIYPFEHLAGYFLSLALYRQDKIRK